MSPLEAWGWDAAWQRAREAVTPADAAPARVVRIDRRLAHAQAEEGELAVRIPGAWRAPLPVVGDWLLVGADAVGLGVRDALALLPRRSLLARAAAGERVEAQAIVANVDVAFLVAGLDGDWSPRRLERYLALCLGSGVAPVVVLNKADACAEPEARCAEARAVAGRHADVLLASAATGQGLDEIRARIGPGRTAVLLGSSGVGKSTLVNALRGETIAEVGEVRAHDQRGRHTTTRREIHPLPDRGLLVDTPGMRELGLWDEAGVEALFDDLDALTRACRFSDCRHETEPGCAIRAAVADGRVAPDRLASWRKLQREMAHRARRQSEHGRAAERAAARGFGKTARAHVAAKRHRLEGD